MPRSATKGRKAETIRTASGYTTRTFNGDRAVCFVSCWGGKTRYEYTYPTLAEAEKICAVIRALAGSANPASPPNKKSRPVSQAAQVRKERRTTGTRV